MERKEKRAREKHPETRHQALQGRVPRMGSPGGWQEAAEEAKDRCRHPGPPGSTATLKVPQEVMASDVPAPQPPPLPAGPDLARRLRLLVCGLFSPALSRLCCSTWNAQGWG